MKWEGFMATVTVCSLDTPLVSFLVGLLVGMLGLVNKVEGKFGTGDGRMAC